MSTTDCRHARLHIGAAPQELPAEIAQHLAGCAECSRFRAETLALDARLRSALEVPLPRFRERAQQPARRLALAASVVLALLLAGGAWLLNPRPALAGEIAEHVVHEAGSWDRQQVLSPADINAVLQQAGVRFDSSLPVVYAMACPFHGRHVPHFVVQTPDGPMTVMLLAHEKVAARTEFSEHGFRGVLLPAGDGSVAVLTRNGAAPDGVAGEVVAAVHW